jgi:hypothetical protein
MTTLIAGGDSFTWGSELPDCNDEKYSRLSWSAIFANKRGYDYNCVAKPGCSNSSIARRVIQAVEQSTENIVVAVMWTHTYRHEVLIESNLDNENSWITLSGFQGLSFEERLKLIHPVDVWHRQKLEKNYQEDIDNGIHDLSKSFFKIVDYNYFDLETIKNIFLLQSYLKSKNIDYIFATATHDIIKLFKNNFLLTDLIDKTCWLNTDIGFKEWSGKNKYPIGKMGHPLKDAHHDWINYYGELK